MAAASALLSAEVEVLVRAMGHAQVGPEEYAEAAAALRKELMWMPGKGCYERAASAMPQERVESAKVGAWVWVGGGRGRGPTACAFAHGWGWVRVGGGVQLCVYMYARSAVPVCVG